MHKIINPTSATGYFRFSRQLYKLSDLDGWFDWFVSRDMPCCVTRLNSLYSLWRAGEESNLPEWDEKSRTDRKIEKIRGKIVREYRWSPNDR